MNDPKFLIIHHTGGSDANPLQDSSNFSFAECDRLHKERFNMKSKLGYYVGYHYYIDKDGTQHNARVNDEEGAHTIGHNLDSIGICLAGNFDATVPTPAQIASLGNLLRSLADLYKIPKRNIVPHRFFAGKTCYGNRLADNWAASLLDPPGAVGGVAKARKLLAEAMEILKDL